jgi:hypothetical protein
VEVEEAAWVPDAYGDQKCITAHTTCTHTHTNACTHTCTHTFAHIHTCILASTRTSTQMQKQNTAFAHLKLVRYGFLSSASLVWLYTTSRMTSMP